MSVGLCLAHVRRRARITFSLGREGCAVAHRAGGALRAVGRAHWSFASAAGAADAAAIIDHVHPATLFAAFTHAAVRQSNAVVASRPVRVRLLARRALVTAPPFRIHDIRFWAVSADAALHRQSKHHASSKAYAYSFPSHPSWACRASTRARRTTEKSVPVHGTQPTRSRARSWLSSAY